MFAVVVHLGDIIAAVCVAVLFLVLGVGYVMDWRDRRDKRKAERRRAREGLRP